MLIKKKVIKDRVLIRVKCDDEIKRAIRPCKYCSHHIHNLDNHYCSLEHWCFHVNLRFSADKGLYKYALKNLIANR